MTMVKFYDPSFIPAGKLTYSVIAARAEGQWIFVRHNNRTTWEISGGHIEKNESPFEAAGRELAEETGAKEFELTCVATYSVDKEGSIGYGRLFVADVTSLGPVPDISEIAEIRLSINLPDKLTYPDIQPHLFRKVLDYLEKNKPV
jgi:8-oxo-dGTP diphosphatase